MEVLWADGGAFVSFFFALPFCGRKHGRGKSDKCYGTWGSIRVLGLFFVSGCVCKSRLIRVSGWSCGWDVLLTKREVLWDFATRLPYVRRPRHTGLRREGKLSKLSFQPSYLANSPLPPPLHVFLI